MEIYNLAGVDVDFIKDANTVIHTSMDEESSIYEYDGNMVLYNEETNKATLYIDNENMDIVILPDYIEVKDHIIDDYYYELTYQPYKLVISQSVFEANMVYNPPYVNNLYFKGTLDDFLCIINNYTNVYLHCDHLYFMDDYGDIVIDGCYFNLLTEVYSDYYIPDNTFNGNNDIVYACINGDIGYGAFSNCSNLRYVEIYDNNRYIRENAFDGCASLESIIFGDFTEVIEEAAFQNCRKLRSIDLINVTEIQNKAFAGCVNLENINLENVSFIGYMAFFECKITDLVLPDTITSIDGLAFSETNLENLVLPNSIRQLRVDSFEYIKSRVLNIYYNGTIDEWANVDIDFQYYPEYNINFFILDPDGTRTYNGSNYRLLTGNVVLENVTKVNIGNFFFMKNLNNIVIPTTVTRIEGDTSWFKNICYNGTVEGFLGIENYCTRNCSDEASGLYILNSTGEIIINGNHYSKVTEIAIPSSFTIIKEHIFAIFSGFDTICIPSSVTRIEMGAISGCYDLYYDGTLSDWLNIDRGMICISYIGNFYLLDSNGNVTHNGKTYSLLEELVIPSNKTTITEYEFIGIQSIKRIILHDNVTFILNGAFANCYGLEEVVLGSGLTTFGDVPFQDDTNIKKIYYHGSERDYSRLPKSSEIEALYEITYFYSENIPTSSGRYWHYDSNNNIEIW